MKNRCKIFYVPTNAILTLLGNWKQHDSFFLPILKGLPDGYEIIATHYEIDRASMGLLVFHESFPEVSPGCRYPVAFDGHWETEIVQVPAMNTGKFKVETCQGAPFFDAGGAVAMFNDAEILSAQIPAVGDAIKEKMAGTRGEKKKVGWEFLGAP